MNYFKHINQNIIGIQAYIILLIIYQYVYCLIYRIIAKTLQIHIKNYFLQYI